MDELHKVFLGMIAVLLVFTIMFGTVAKIQQHNQGYIDTMVNIQADR